jgi:hypothetical protein
MTYFVVNIIDKNNYQIHGTQLLLTAINFPANHEIPLILLEQQFHRRIYNSL